MRDHRPVRTDLRIERETDIVIQTNPPAGAQIVKGGRVELTVARDGRRVPNLIGMSPSTAEEAIKEAGLTVGDITRKDNDGDVPIVTSLLATPRTLVELGTKVDFIVEREPNGGWRKSKETSMVGKEGGRVDAVIRVGGNVQGRSPSATR
jgi:serine/threonine-protein kinase